MQNSVFKFGKCSWIESVFILGIRLFVSNSIGGGAVVFLMLLSSFLEDSLRTLAGVLYKSHDIAWIHLYLRVTNPKLSIDIVSPTL